MAWLRPAAFHPRPETRKAIARTIGATGVTGDAAPIRSGTGAPQQPCKLCFDSGLSGGLLVERVFGIKALQRMIDMHGCQQIPGIGELPSPRPRCRDCLILSLIKRFDVSVIDGCLWQIGQF
jgi:hypothetical protein